MSGYCTTAGNKSNPDADDVRNTVLSRISGDLSPGYSKNHDFGVDKFLPIIKAARVGFPGLWLGVNFLAVSGKEAFPKLARLQNEDCHVDA
ncbi:MAG: hypothetical protein ACNYPI_10300 [Arenicellales bacterium WSBS_2016_MAG_OTU3]